MVQSTRSRARPKTRKQGEEGIGKVTGDHSTVAEGKGDQASSDVRDAERRLRTPFSTYQ